MESKFKARCGEELGHEVDLIDFWNDYNWNSFDVVIVLQFGGMFRTMVPLIRKLAKKLVLAPIIDTNLSHFKYKIITKYWGCQKYLGLTSRFHDMYLNRNLFDLYLARSEYEASYIEQCLEIPRNRIAIVPLSIRTAFNNEFPQKELLIAIAMSTYFHPANKDSLSVKIKKYSKVIETTLLNAQTKLAISASV